MAVVAAYAVPHPPLIVPSVGRGQQLAIRDTIDAYETVARSVATDMPDLIVIASPHAPAFRDGFFVSLAPAEVGSMEVFGAADEIISIKNDLGFAEAVVERLSHRGIAVGPAPQGQESLDHGTFVPLYFLAQTVDLDRVPVLRLGLSGLPDKDHELVGETIAAVANERDCRVVFVASGDWSHKLKEDGPYGFVEEGPVFDQKLGEIFTQGSLTELFSLDRSVRRAAAECGMGSFEIMAGALKGLAFQSELLSYEGPFGVGYGVAAFKVIGSANSSTEEAAVEAFVFGADPLVDLARATVEAYIGEGRRIDVPKDFPKEFTNRKAGVFVSLHERGELRGCIGTIEPQTPSIATEVIANGISASTADPRFPAVGVDELDYLSYSVDVLGTPEPVTSLEQLDPKTYGVIVTSGFKRGLLLPDLEGVDTVADQLAIAKRKAGIGLTEDCAVERFEVIRHSAGGEARCG